MPRHLGSVLPSVVAVCTATLFTPAFMTLGNPAHAIGDCVAAPGSSTPQGSHWYYRTDRATQRKCWYLGSQNPTVQDAASRTVPQAPGAADSGTSPIAGDTNEAVTPPPQLEPRQ